MKLISATDSPVVGLVSLSIIVPVASASTILKRLFEIFDICTVKLSSPSITVSSVIANNIGRVSPFSVPAGKVT